MLSFLPLVLLACWTPERFAEEYPVALCDVYTRCEWAIAAYYWDILANPTQEAADENAAMQVDMVCDYPEEFDLACDFDAADARTCIHDLELQNCNVFTDPSYSWPEECETACPDPG